MGVNTTGLLNTQTEVYASYKNDAVTKNETAAKKDSTAKTEEKNESGVVYDKSDSSKDNKKATYSINKMSAEDRAALVQQMKADTQSRQQQLISIVQKMMTGQAATSSVANGTNSDDIWKFLAKGDFTVDAATKAQAQKDISEDGYYGIKQTSERLFDFASALAGDDVEKMKKMQTAMQKGFKRAPVHGGKTFRTSARRPWMLQIRSLRIIISPKRAQQRPKAENRLLQPGDCLQKKGKNTGKRGVFSLLFLFRMIRQ